MSRANVVDTSPYLTTRAPCAMSVPSCGSPPAAYPFFGDLLRLGRHAQALPIAVGTPRRPAVGPGIAVRWNGNPWSVQEVLDGDGDVPDPDAGGVVDGVGDGGGHAHHGDLADPLGAEGTVQGVRVLHEVDVDVGDVGVDRDQIA